MCFLYQVQTVQLAEVYQGASVADGVEGGPTHRRAGPQAGRREVLGFTVGERENQGAWEDLCDDLKRRGVKEADLWITDGNQATINALAPKFSTSQRQRCVQHKMDNVLDYIPNSQQGFVF
jgi:transposase-like protein